MTSFMRTIRFYKRDGSYYFRKGVKQLLIIDGHSHFGEDFFHGITLLEDYIKLIDDVGINYGLLMPTPCPINSDTKTRVLNWKIDNNQIVYSVHSQCKTNRNPYKDINYVYYKKLRNMNSAKLLFVPMIHPMLDDIDYLKKLVRDIQPVALKIHGVGSGVDPYEIPEEFTQFVKSHDLMVIAHTDFDNGNDKTRYDTLLLRSLNTPFRWCKYFSENQINGVINHGATLDFDVLKMINESTYLKVALGPDKIIQFDVNRLRCSKSDLTTYGYLSLIKNHVSADKIIFDIDFNWNINPETHCMDTVFIESIKAIWRDEKSQRKIFANNLLDHCSKLRDYISNIPNHRV